MSFTDDCDGVFGALSDPTRRGILDQLRDQPRSTGELCEKFPKLSRFAVMKHLDVLEEAGLVIVKREGRVRWNHINAVPIQMIYERWMNRFAAPHAASLLKLAKVLEEK
jgi:DNA-binding transcriptional ArsR family regulator